RGKEHEGFIRSHEKRSASGEHCGEKEYANANKGAQFQAMNKTLKEIHDLLVARVESLSKAIHGTQDMRLAEQLLLEMHEVVHRVDLIQNLLFTQGSAELDAY